MDQADLTEISEALWAGAKRAAISQTLCYEQTDACKKKPPPLPKVISLNFCHRSVITTTGLYPLLFTGL